VRSLSFASADRSRGQATRLTAGYGCSSFVEGDVMGGQGATPARPTAIPFPACADQNGPSFQRPPSSPVAFLRCWRVSIPQAPTPPPITSPSVFKEPSEVTADPLTLSLRFAAMGELHHSVICMSTPKGVISAKSNYLHEYVCQSGRKKAHRLGGLLGLGGAT
jgi:hypothetical protein